MSFHNDIFVLSQALRALNTAPRFKVGETDSYEIARLVQELLRQKEFDHESIDS
jgi:hypothetical protein